MVTGCAPVVDAGSALVSAVAGFAVVTGGNALVSTVAGFAVVTAGGAAVVAAG